MRLEVAKLLMMSQVLHVVLTVTRNIWLTVAAHRASTRSPSCTFHRGILLSTHTHTCDLPMKRCALLVVLNGAAAFTPSRRNELLDARDAWLSDASSATAMYGHISTWNTSEISDMSGVFCGGDAHYSSYGINEWNSACNPLAQHFNDDISAWDTSACTNAQYMFFKAYDFNQDLSSWDISSCTNMEGMFMRDSAFTQDLCWDLSGVDNTDDMFTYSSGSIANCPAPTAPTPTPVPAPTAPTPAPTPAATDTISTDAAGAARPAITLVWGVLLACAISLDWGVLACALAVSF